MVHPSLASAVVLPDASPSPSPPPQAGTKRTQDEPSERATSPKRQRTSPASTKNDARDLENGHATSPPAHPDRTRKAPAANGPAKPVADETRDKHRNQRLFGALLGGMGGGARAPRDSIVAKRRQEQEERRKEEARKREAELGERQRERLEKLQVERRIEQRKVDEMNLRVRHNNLRAMANFLQTETEPKLYYNPWKLRPEEEETIKRQKDDVEILIDRELDDFADLKQRWREEDGDLDEADPREDGPLDNSSPDKAEETATDNPDSNAVKQIGPDIVNTSIEQQQSGGATSQVEAASGVTQDESAQHPTSATGPIPEDAQQDEGDVIVEGEEDTVIY